MIDATMQVIVFLLLTAAVAVATWWKCRHAVHSGDTSKDFFLAGGGLAYVSEGAVYFARPQKEITR
mgnify:CR=1 FL=1